MAAPNASSSSAVIEVSTEGKNWRVPGIIIASEGKELTLRTHEEVPKAAAVRIQGTNDLMYLGEVLNSFQRAEFSWQVSVAVKRSLMVL